MKASTAIALACIAALATSGCTGSGVVGAHRYSAYGIVNADQNKNPQISYRVSVLNAVLAVVFVETVIVPVVVVGWQLFVPDKVLSPTPDPSQKGIER